MRFKMINKVESKNKEPKLTKKENIDLLKELVRANLNKEFNKEKVDLLINNISFTQLKKLIDKKNL